MAYRFKLSDQELLKEFLHILKVKGDIDVMSTTAIKEFGTIQKVFEGAPQDLKKIKDFTPTVIKNLKTVSALFKEIIKTKTYPSKSPPSFPDLDYFIRTSPNLDGDCLRLLFLDENHVILKDFIYKVGSGSKIDFYFREIVREVLSAGISHLVLIHHKVGNCADPMPNDNRMYKEFSAGLKALDINLVDYLIISKNNLYSFNRKKHFYPANDTLENPLKI